MKVLDGAVQRIDQSLASGAAFQNGTILAPGRMKSPWIASQLETFMKEKARLLLDEGVIFGQAGAGFERFNVACPRPVLKQALDQLRDAIRELDLQAD